MRELSSAQETVLQGEHFKVEGKLEIATSAESASFNDLTNFGCLNWLSRVDIERTLDNSVGTMKAWLRRDASSSLSLSPLRSDSTLNQDSTGGNLPALDVSRRIKYSVSTIPASCTGEDFQLIFDGYIDSWDAKANPMLVTCRDQGGILMDRWIEDSTKTYGGGQVEDIINSILTDWTTLAGAPLQFSSSPGSRCSNTHKRLCL